jgi:long-chain acyl-CoA synthetase
VTPESSRADQLFGLLEEQARVRPAHVAARSRRGGTWQWTTWGDLRDAACAVGMSLLDGGVKGGDRVAVMSSTREEWTVADFGILAAGAATVPIYPTATSEQVAFILANSGAVVAVLEGRAQLEVVQAALEAAPALREIALLEGIGPFAPLTRAGAPEVTVTSYTELVRRGRARFESADGASALRRRGQAVKPDDLATVVYTSGTTGPPRGVALTHRALLAETRSLLEAFSIGPHDEQLLLLPLAHILAKTLVLAHVASGSRLAYADGPHRLVRDLSEVEPTFFATVPRLLEKIYAVANDSARAEGKVKAALYAWALDVGKHRADTSLRGIEPRRLSSAMARYADKLVLGRIRATFGERLRFVLSGGAPLSRELAEWLFACGVTVLEGYGLTEIGGASHVNRADRFRLGTVGEPLRGFEAKLAADGEILLRGPSMMSGYFANPEATRAALDDDGWLHTGDIGRLDEEGYLRIVDRKKDVLVTAGGSNVAPQNIEGLLLGSPFLDGAVVIGDRRPYLVALVTLDVETCRRWAEERHRPSDLPSLAKDPELVALIQLDVDGVNHRLSSFETVKRFFVVPRPFSKEMGELTELGKVRRDAIRANFADAIEALYRA